MIRLKRMIFIWENIGIEMNVQLEKRKLLDNSPTENFFSIRKREMFYEYEFEFKTLIQLKGTIIVNINYYNNVRISYKLKGLSPIKFRHQSIQSLII